MRLPADHRPALPAAVRALRRRAWHPPGRPLRRHAPPDRRLGCPAAARGHAVRPASPLSRPRSRQQVRASLRPRRGDDRDPRPAHGLPRAQAERHLRALPRERPAASASTTCGCSPRRTCGGRSASTSPTSTRPGRTKGCASACRCQVNCQGRHGTIRARSWPSPSSAGCTTPTSTSPDQAADGHTHGLVVVTATRLARSAPARSQAARRPDQARPGGTSLAVSPWVGLSPPTAHLGPRIAGLSRPPTRRTEPSRAGREPRRMPGG